MDMFRKEEVVPLSVFQVLTGMGNRGASIKEPKAYSSDIPGMRRETDT